MRSAMALPLKIGFYALTGIGKGMAESRVWHRNAYVPLDAAALIADALSKLTHEKRWEAAAAAHRKTGRDADEKPMPRDTRGIA